MEKILKPKIIFLDEDKIEEDVDISYECGRCPPGPIPALEEAYQLNSEKAAELSAS